MTEFGGVPSYPVYQPMPPAPGRPGTTTAAAVLGFVQAGLAISGGLATFFGVLGASAEENDGLHGQDAFRTVVAGDFGLLTTLAVLVMLGGGLVIAGSVTLLGGRSRVLYLAGMGSQLAFCIAYFVLGAIAVHRVNEIQSVESGDSPTFAFMVLAVFFAVMPIVGLALASVRATTEYLQVKGLETNQR